MVYVEQVQRLTYGVVDYVIYGLWSMVEGGHRRHNYGSHAAQSLHAFQVAYMERGLPYQ